MASSSMSWSWSVSGWRTSMTTMVPRSDSRLPKYPVSSVPQWARMAPCDLGKAIARQVDQPAARLQLEKVEQPGGARALARPGQPLALRDRVDCARFTGIGTAGHGDFGPRIRGHLAQFVRAGEESDFGVCGHASCQWDAPTTREGLSVQFTACPAGRRTAKSPAFLRPAPVRFLGVDSDMTAKFAALTLVAVFGWTGSVHAAGTVEAGQAKSAACMACHGMDGNSANPEWPSLAGQHSSYIVKQLKHFKAGERQNALMCADGHDPVRPGHGRPRGVLLVAEASLPRARRSPPSSSSARRSTAPASRRRACRRAPAATARAAPASRVPRSRRSAASTPCTPRLQLRNYKSGARATDPNSMMRTITSRLTDEEIDAVASYLQGMR